MKRYLPLLGIFLLFFLVVSGFARAEGRTCSAVTGAGQPVTLAQELAPPAVLP